jgi:hypothetical protein
MEDTSGDVLTCGLLGTLLLAPCFYFLGGEKRQAREDTGLTPAIPSVSETSQ